MENRNRKKARIKKKKNERNGNIHLFNANLMVISIELVHAASVCTVCGDKGL